MPVGLRYDGYFVSMSFESACYDGRTEGWMIHVGITREEDDIELIPSSQFAFLLSGRQKICQSVFHSYVLVCYCVCVFCLVGGIAAPWLLPLVSGAFPVQAQVSSVVSQPMIALLLIACPLLPFLLMIFFKGDRLAARSRGAAWVCGYDHEQSMVVTAHGFAMPVKEAFAPLLKLRHWLNPVRLVPGWQSASAPALLRGIALVELAVLVVIVISRGA